MRELPARKRERFQALGLSRYDTLLLADDVATAEYFDAAIAAGAAPKPAANWILSDLSKHCNVRLARDSLRLLSSGSVLHTMRSAGRRCLCSMAPAS
jgi:Asp-tRNA(Asn)/Glu-tRNA(Gln) amidotransferase B subunit